MKGMEGMGWRGKGKKPLSISQTSRKEGDEDGPLRMMRVSNLEGQEHWEEKVST